VTDHTYHGNTTAVAALGSTNPSDTSNADHVRRVPAPDTYRGANADDFTAAVVAAIADLEATEYGFAALLVCPFFANEGFPDVAHGFLNGAVAATRAAGGLFIADEVQPGFGRLGDAFWGHTHLGVVPDVVTLGKPMGNGHPVAGVVTTTEILSAFRDGFRYFNTFGGNPVSAAAANAVLDVLEDEELPGQAADTGRYARACLEELAQRHAVIGDVRGTGLFFGVELTTDPAARTPATEYTLRVVEACRQRGILLNKNGIGYATLKVRPNLQFRRAHVDQLVDTLDQVFEATPL
ncbi:MAG: aminotransferase class III-fold pyridoxal phosphate-dependent enzyme, partial [Pseudomonadota bacterium]